MAHWCRGALNPADATTLRDWILTLPPGPPVPLVTQAEYPKIHLCLVMRLNSSAVFCERGQRDQNLFTVHLRHIGGNSFWTAYLTRRSELPYTSADIKLISPVYCHPVIQIVDSETHFPASRVSLSHAGTDLMETWKSIPLPASSSAERTAQYRTWLARILVSHLTLAYHAQYENIPLCERGYGRGAFAWEKR